MKKTFKTLLAVLLALTLVCALFIPVFADGAASPDTPTDAPKPTDGGNNGGAANDPCAPPEPTCATEPACDGECQLGENLPVAPPDKPKETLNPNCADCFDIQWEAKIPFIKDYSKWYTLGTLIMGECAKVKVYILDVDGNLYSSVVKDLHHGTYEVQWNGLRTDGTHPGGTWNDPKEVRFTITVIATDIDGYDHYFGAWFTYKFYDNDRPEKAADAAAPAANGAAGGKAGGDVPHTGL